MIIKYDEPTYISCRINMIKKVAKEDDFYVLASLLNDSFITVANEFGITKENCPFHNAFLNGENLKNKLIPIREFYTLLVKEKPVGFIVIEKSEKEEGTFYIEKLAVHPDYRHQGYGIQLMEFATYRIKELGGKRISVGLIDAHSSLKTWYANQGYKETGTKVFDHLPFTVCFMDRNLDN